MTSSTSGDRSFVIQRMIWCWSSRWLQAARSLHAKAREVARQEGISINQLVTTALAEKLSALLTEEYLEARAQRGNRGKFERVLAKVPSRDPDPGDEL